MAAGGIDFNSTTKVVAYMTTDQRVDTSVRLTSVPDIRLDTLGEFDGTYFPPLEAAWYGVGCSLQFRGGSIPFDDTCRVRVYNGGTVLLNYGTSSSPLSYQNITVQFYTFLYVTESDFINIRRFFDVGSDTGGNAILKGSEGSCMFFVNRIL